MTPRIYRPLRLAACLALVAAACRRPADVVLKNAQVHTLAWNDPARDGSSAPGAPHDAGGWHRDASAVAIRGDRIVWVGFDEDSALKRLVGPRTRIVDLHGAALFPGFVDSHVHIEALGAALERVNLLRVATEAEAVDRVVSFAARAPGTGWIVGWGWDDGAWADRYPDLTLLSRRLSDRPVILRGLHGYAAWVNRLALERAGITAATPNPDGGEIVKGKDGQPTGILLNRAVALVDRVIPAPTPRQLSSRVLRALEAMEDSGYTGLTDASVNRTLLSTLDTMDAHGQLKIKVGVMLDLRDSALVKEWIARGPWTSRSGRLAVRTVKAFADGALGSRGARLAADYADQPGHRGVPAPGFDHALLARAMDAGFTASIHAIGDQTNHEALDFLDSVLAAHPRARALRNRIEHAQVLAKPDVPRFAASDVIASVQPPHAVEDMAWAQDRLGEARVQLAYAWRTLRRAGARLVFSSDLAGSSYNIFYGLHSAQTRTDRKTQPPGGWFPDQVMSAEEAVRGYTSWAAYAGFDEAEGGLIAPGRRADLTALSPDPLEAPAESLLAGRVVLTMASGEVLRLAPPAPNLAKADTASVTDSAAMAPWLAIDYTKDSVRMSDLAILTDEQRPLVRGIVFGRHGRVFKDEQIEDWLASQPWYHARPDFSNEELNDVERRNLDVIRAAETLGHPSIELGDMRFYKDRFITGDQLAGRSLTELRVLAAEVEAEHGRRFDDDPWLASYFAGRYWYHAADTYDPSTLNEVERANLGVINATMKHDRRLALAPGDMEHYRTTEITETMLHGLGLNELRILRNEVYARRGRHYDGGGWLSRYFANQDWYQPSRDTTPPVLTDIEDHNVRVIVAYENRLHEALTSQPIDTTLLAGMFLEDARKLRYEIYARHGKVFPQRRLQTYFASFPWYHANPRWVDTDLSALERRNAGLILAYEKGALRTIDAFEG